MAGNSVRPASIGVRPALRRAREIAGITLDEAARDTRLTPDQIGALESEDFDLLGEEVYVRAMLRTYAQYLGLKPDKVMSAYAKHAEEPELPSLRRRWAGSSRRSRRRGSGQPAVPVDLPPRSS